MVNSKLKFNIKSNEILILKHNKIIVPLNHILHPSNTVIDL